MGDPRDRRVPARARGITVTTEVRNNCHLVAPFGLGFHPDITVGTDTIDRRDFVRQRSGGYLR